MAAFYLRGNPDWRDPAQAPSSHRSAMDHGRSCIVVKFHDDPTSSIWGVSFGPYSHTVDRHSSKPESYSYLVIESKQLLGEGNNSWYRTLCKTSSSSSHEDDINELVHRFYNTMITRDRKFASNQSKAQIFWSWLIQLTASQSAEEWLQVYQLPVRLNDDQCRGPLEPLPIQYQIGSIPHLHTYLTHKSRKEQRRIHNKKVKDYKNMYEFFKSAASHLDISEGNAKFKDRCSDFKTKYNPTSSGDKAKLVELMKARRAHLERIKTYRTSAICQYGLGDDNPTLQLIDGYLRNGLKDFGTDELLVKWLESGASGRRQSSQSARNAGPQRPPTRSGSSRLGGTASGAPRSSHPIGRNTSKVSERTWWNHFWRN